MKINLFALFNIVIFGISIGYTAFTTEMLDRNVSSYVYGKSLFPTLISGKITPPYRSCLPYEADMKYHGTPSFYWTLTGSNYALAGYFEPNKFSVDSNFMIKTIGFIGYVSNGNANVYIFLAERNSHPDCTPPEFTKKMYGPYNGHINNSYPDYDDLDVYSLKWLIKKVDIDSQVNKRFWVLYHLPTSPPPYPLSDESTNSKNSCYYVPGTGWGSGG